MMRFKDNFHNIIVKIKKHLFKYAYIYIPIFGLIVFFLFKYITKFTVDTNFISNVINISGILAGFLFTSLGIIITLPDNKFTERLKSTNIINIIYKAMITGILALLTSVLVGLFNISDLLLNILFISGISETFLSACYLFIVTSYSSKSK